jgi:hypothetical protein
VGGARCLFEDTLSQENEIKKINSNAAEVGIKYINLEICQYTNILLDFWCLDLFRLWSSRLRTHIRL